MGQFVMLPQNLLDYIADKQLEPIDIAVYFALRSYWSESRQTPVYAARGTVAKQIRRSKDTLDLAMKRLYMTGVIGITKRVGYTNHITFIDTIPLGGRMDTERGAVLMPTPLGATTQGEAASARPKPEPTNQNYKPEKSYRFMHYGDQAFVESDGEVTIIVHSGERVRYSGGDDDGFRFNGLTGTEARRAAVAHYTKN